MSEERWEDIEGYEQLYQVSTKGNVRRLYAHHTRLLNPYKNRNGYLVVTLTKDGERKYFLVHRLVAKAFIPNPRNVAVVNHRDESTDNNCVENLEWVTQKENVNYGTARERLKASLKEHYKDHPYHNCKPVRCVESGKIYLSAVQAAKELNLNRKQISACLTGRHLSTGGYHWEYARSERKLRRSTNDICRDIFR